MIIFQLEIVLKVAHLDYFVKVSAFKARLEDQSRVLGRLKGIKIRQLIEVA